MTISFKKFSDGLDTYISFSYGNYEREFLEGGKILCLGRIPSIILTAEVVITVTAKKRSLELKRNLEVKSIKI